MAARAGDRDALGALIDGEARAAFRVARVIVRDDRLAQDAIQEACLRAWRDLPSLREGERWPQWFRRIAVRAAIDQARRRRREVLDRPANGLPVAPDASQAVAQRDQVARALRDLSTDERALLALRYAADLEVPDVAAALGIPLGTAKSRLHRALAKLRARFEIDDE